MTSSPSTLPTDAAMAVSSSRLSESAPACGYELVVAPHEASLLAMWNAGARGASGELLVFASADAREGISAFTEKRSPRFSGS